jgi:transcriptional regulator with XRE-family HTH domain
MMEGEPASPVAEFCADLSRLRQASGLDVADLAKQLSISRAQLYAILNGEIKRPPDWEKVVRPLVLACAGDDSQALARWRHRHAVLLGVVEDLRRRERRVREPTPGAPGGPPPVEQASALPGEAPKRRRYRRAWLLVIAAGAAGSLLAVLVVVPGLTNSQPPSSPAAAIQPALQPPIFRDTLASPANGWLDASVPAGHAGYRDGAYLMYGAANTNGSQVLSFPTDDSAMYPQASPDIRVQAYARPLPGSPQNRLNAYFITCRAGPATGYEFAIGDTVRNPYVSIDKILNYNFTILKAVSTPVIRADAYNLIQAQCTRLDGGPGVQLVLSVNGTIVDSCTDTQHPIESGSTGVGVSDDTTEPVEAEFTSFTVRQVE